MKIVLDEILGDFTEAIITLWHVNEGAVVNRGDDLFEVATDKATFDVSSSHDGVLKRIFKTSGLIVTPGEIVAEVEEKI